MRQALFICIHILLAVASRSQTVKPAVYLDCSHVKAIAREWGVYWTGNWICPPYMKLDSLTRQWTLITCKVEYTKKGDCKYTNGCTISTTATLVVDAVTGRTSLEKHEKLFHNFE